MMFVPGFLCKRNHEMQGLYPVYVYVLFSISLSSARDFKTDFKQILLLGLSIEIVESHF